MKKVLFGAGAFANHILDLIENKEVEFIVDNDEKKEGTQMKGIPIHAFKNVKESLLEYEIIIAVTDKYVSEIEQQLDESNLGNYYTYGEYQVKVVKEKIKKPYKIKEIYERAIKWIFDNSINNECIICYSDKPEGYPEVTGYFIPSLLRWGYRDLAINYADWLISVQQADGSWLDADQKAPYVFDTAQVLKGLIKIREAYKTNIVRIDDSIRKGCDWILSNMQQNGRLITPSTECWGTDKNTCSELIHLYCISPIRDSGILFGCARYIEAAEKIYKYYKIHYYDKIMNFGLLSHFYAYVMEALLDLGHEDICREAMRKVAILQKKSGAVPAYNNVDWVCSTGLFQFALVWYRLGDIERGNRAFEYACKLQNSSGGWYGSYLSEDNPKEINSYLSKSEISWANKFFLDALYYKNATNAQID